MLTTQTQTMYSAGFKTSQAMPYCQMMQSLIPLLVMQSPPSSNVLEQGQVANNRATQSHYLKTDVLRHLFLRIFVTIFLGDSVRYCVKQRIIG